MAESISPPVFEEKPIPRWEKITAVIYVVVVTVCVVVFRKRLHADFWPLDDARVSPNILATVIQIVLYTPVVVLLWPPARRRIHHFIDRHTAPLHAHFDRLHEQRERHHAEQMEKMDAIHDHLRKHLPTADTVKRQGVTIKIPKS